ncbi:MAG TPA: hypothetical protein VMT15_21410 [Bryobacteraceae bacterium]|nr:hypothetical protein [Bryobacteraceae bacterium]
MRLQAGVLASLALALPCLATELYESVADDANLPIIAQYQSATKTQQAALRGAQMNVDIDAKLPRLEKQGKLIALRTISTLGKIGYKILGFQGDDTIKQEVIARFLQAEMEAAKGEDIAITPANYKFRHKGSMEQNGVRTEMFQVTPKRKRVGLFKGDLWLDASTGMPVRESGQFVKTPSVFLKKVEFVRVYQIQDGIAIPKHLESIADVRVFGRAELNIDFTNFTKRDPIAEEPGSDR